jgi:NDP-sugar pyrophosphorylase family protein
MKAVILAGGLGERLKPFTQAIPKPLLPIGEQSLLEIQIANLAAANFRSIYIATNYKSQYIESFIGDGSKYGVSIGYSREEKPLGTCGPLSLLRSELNEPLILMNGDILTTIDFRRFYDYGDGQESDFTVGTKNIITPFSFGKVHIDGNRIIKVEEKAEIYTRSSPAFISCTAILSVVPDDTYFGIDDLVELMLRDGRPITRYLIEEYWLTSVESKITASPKKRTKRTSRNPSRRQTAHFRHAESMSWLRCGTRAEYSDFLDKPAALRIQGRRDQGAFHRRLSTDGTRTLRDGCPARMSTSGTAP